MVVDMLFNFDHIETGVGGWFANSNTWSSFGTGETAYLAPLTKYITPIAVGPATRVAIFERSGGDGVTYKGITFEYGINLKIKALITRDVLGFRLTGEFGLRSAYSGG